MKKILTVFTLILSLGLLPIPPAFAAPPMDVTNNRATISFPNTITFSAEISVGANITSVVLEYGTNQLTCGEVIAKAFPQFAPGKSIRVEWTWDMRQSTSLPPGATVWWRWRYTDETGKETVSDQKTTTWLDSEHNWQTVTSGQLRLHWYSGDQAFAQSLLTAAKNGLEFNKKNSGLTTESAIDLYIYADQKDLRDAILYEPAWTGGLTFSEHNIVIIGISQDELYWGRNAIVHELTHVLVGHLTFSCLGDMPTWLSEGLAVYSEPDSVSVDQDQLDQAVQDNTLIDIRALSAGFSEVVGTMSLSYSEAYSIVKFLLDTYGQDKMKTLLTTLRDGTAIDEALMQTYGFNVDGLEDAWRESLHAQPRTASAQPTAQPTPTYVPTIVPVSGAPLANQLTTPTPIPTSSLAEPITSTPSTSNNRPATLLMLVLLGCGCLLVLIIGVTALAFFLRAQNRKGGKNAQ